MSHLTAGKPAHSGVDLSRQWSNKQSQQMQESLQQAHATWHNATANGMLTAQWAGCDRVMRSKEEQDEGGVNKGLLGWKSLESEPVGLTCHEP